MTEIAKNAHVSRQRIEQILQEGGVDTMKQTAANVAYRHEQRAMLKLSRAGQIRQAREEAARERYQPWITAWDQGATLAEMALMFGTTSSAVGSVMHSLRDRYGWFPYRRSTNVVENMTTT